MNHQCVAALAANSPHSGLSRAISIVSSKVRLCRDRSFFRVAIQEECGRPTGLLQSLWGTAVRILLASSDSSILIRWPNSMSLGVEWRSGRYHYQGALNLPDLKMTDHKKTTAGKCETMKMTDLKGCKQSCFKESSDYSYDEET